MKGPVRTINTQIARVHFCLELIRVSLTLRITITGTLGIRSPSAAAYAKAMVRDIAISWTIRIFINRYLIYMRVDIRFSNITFTSKHSPRHKIIEYFNSTLSYLSEWK